MSAPQKVRNLAELAQLAGVSTSTVSRALDDSQLIASKTRKRIQELARQHGYRPNIMARNLRTQRTGAIGVVIPLGHETGQLISDPFFMTMLGLLADGLTGKGYDLVLSRVIPEQDDWLEKMTASGRVDGLIIIGQSNQSKTIDKVAESYRNMVVWGGHNLGQVHCSVGTDNYRGGRIAAQHLIDKGCERIAFFGDPRILEISQRYEGFKGAIEEADLGDKFTELRAHLVAETAQPEIIKFLESQSERPDGIFAATDVIAMTALRALSDLGMSVPGEVKVVGFDDLPIAKHTVPRLTTVRQDLERGAERLISLLFERIDGQENESVILAPKLVQRSST